MFPFQFVTDQTACPEGGGGGRKVQLKCFAREKTWIDALAKFAGSSFKKKLVFFVLLFKNVQKSHFRPVVNDNNMYTFYICIS